MVVTKKSLCKRIIMPIITMSVGFASIMFIVYLVVSLLSDYHTPFMQIILFSLMSMFPIVLVLGITAIINISKGLKWIKEQEEFYQIDFDDDVKDVTMKTQSRHDGYDWYIDIEGFRMIVFKNGFIARFEKYKKVGWRHGGTEHITAVCLDGKKRRLKGGSPSITNLRKWVGKCRKQEKLLEEV